MCLCMPVCMCMFLCACRCVLVYLCAYVYVCVCIRVRVCVPADGCVQLSVSVRVYACVCVCARVLPMYRACWHRHKGTPSPILGGRSYCRQWMDPTDGIKSLLLLDLSSPGPQPRHKPWAVVPQGPWGRTPPYLAVYHRPVMWDYATVDLYLSHLLPEMPLKALPWVPLRDEAPNEIL